MAPCPKMTEHLLEGWQQELPKLLVKTGGMLGEGDVKSSA